MDVMMAAFRLVQALGADVLAPVVGKSPTTLRHEVNPHCGHAKLGLADAVALSEWTNDRQILDAFALRMGCMVVPLVAAVPGAEGVAAATAALAREFGELMAECATDLADGRVSDNERARIERGGAELITALGRLLADVRAMSGAPAPVQPEQQRAPAAEPLKAVA